jgi:hypothetical protein
VYLKVAPELTDRVFAFLRERGSTNDRLDGTDQLT